MLFFLELYNMLFQKRFEELFLLTEQQFEIALGSRLGPCFRHKLPVVVWFCINRSHLFNFFHQIVALVALAAIDDTLCYMLLIRI